MIAFKSIFVLYSQRHVDSISPIVERIQAEGWKQRHSRNSFQKFLREKCVIIGE